MTYDAAGFLCETPELTPWEGQNERLEFCVLMVALCFGRWCRCLHCTCLILAGCQQLMRFFR